MENIFKRKVDKAPASLPGSKPRLGAQIVIFFMASSFSREITIYTHISTMNVYLLINPYAAGG